MKENLNVRNRYIWCIILQLQLRFVVHNRGLSTDTDDGEGHVSSFPNSGFELKSIATNSSVCPSPSPHSPLSRMAYWAILGG